MSGSAAKRFKNSRIIFLPSIIPSSKLISRMLAPFSTCCLAIVTASFENYLKFWTKKEGFELIATRAEVKMGKLTGQFSTPNCHGEEKINRIKAAYNLADFEFVYAYGDTKGDLALKAIANEFSYKPFRN